MPPDDSPVTLADDLAYVLDFCKRVRRFAAGHNRGGLGKMHQMAGECVRRIEAQQDQLPPLQPSLIPEPA